MSLIFLHLDAKSTNFNVNNVIQKKIYIYYNNSEPKKMASWQELAEKYKNDESNSFYQQNLNYQAHYLDVPPNKRGRGHHHFSRGQNFQNNSRSKRSYNDRGNNRGRYQNHHNHHNYHHKRSYSGNENQVLGGGKRSKQSHSGRGGAGGYHHDPAVNSYLKPVAGNSKPFRCESCDKNFFTQELKDVHLQEHIKCPANNCNFEAHYMLIDKHFEAVHTIKPGQIQHPEMDQCWNLNTKEEIDQWRANRRKKYPKLENVIKASEERESRFVKNEARKQKRIDTEMEKAGEMQLKLLLEAEKKQKEKFERENKLENCMETELPKSDTEEMAGESQKLVTPKPEIKKFNPAVTMFLPPQLQAKPSSKTVPGNEKSENKPEIEAKNDKNDKNTLLQNTSFQQNQNLIKNRVWPPLPANRQNNNLPQQNFKGLDGKNSLLRKLLKSEMDREKNLLIQCIEYVVRNNFYQMMEVEKSQPEEVEVTPEISSHSPKDSNESSSESESGSSETESPPVQEAIKGNLDRIIFVLVLK